MKLIPRSQFDILLANRHLTVTALSERASMNPSNVSRILSRGTCFPSTAAKLADALGVSVQQIAAQE